MTTNQSALSPQVSSKNEQIELLLPYLFRIARHHYRRNFNTLLSQPDDLVQDAVVALLVEPIADSCGSGLYITIASRRLSDKTKAERAYDRYVHLMPILVDDEGEAIDLAELLPSPDLDPEAALIRAEETAALAERFTSVVAQLNPVQRQILALLAVDYKKSEIAEHLGLSRARISQHLDCLRRAFADLAADCK